MLIKHPPYLIIYTKFIQYFLTIIPYQHIHYIIINIVFIKVCGTFYVLQ